MRALVTGGAGFIGSALTRRLAAAGHDVLNIDKLTYAGRPEAVAEAAAAPGYRFAQHDIADRPAIAAAFAAFRPDRVFHLAAESHVDRSIENAAVFVTTNVLGTQVMLDCALGYWSGLDPGPRAGFRFVHVSTDEVYGALGDTGVFTEDTAYAPNSPYAASKAGSDHLARAWHRTYGLPVLITNSSNNYGPWQHPEKLIPTILRNALAGQPIPIYGQGSNVRDWIYVEDHVDGLLAAAAAGVPGEKYNFGGGAETSNLEMARAICAVLDRRRPRADGRPHAEAIAFVTDRPGHDHRYAVDTAKAATALGWAPRHAFAQGIAETVDWFLAHPAWFDRGADELARLGLGRTG